MQFPQPLQRLGITLSTLGVGLLGLTATAPTAQAAEEVVLTYGFLQQSVPVNDLARFARTGKQTWTLQLLVATSGQDPDKIREVLNEEIPLKKNLADRVLSTGPGETALREVGTVVHHNENEGRVDALRQAIVDSADDDRVSLIEVLENYPSDAMYFDGERLVELVSKMQPLLEQVGTIQDVLDILGGL